VLIRFNQKYGKTQKILGGATKDDDACTRILHFFCYDCVVFFFMIFLILQGVWFILVPIFLGIDTPQCKEQLGYIWGWLNWGVLFMVFFIELVGGCFGLIMVTCMEGQFTCDNVASCLIACFTFGSIDYNRVNATNA